MHLLTLPDELFLTEIFPYLHSTDLIRAFGTLGNTRLVPLIYTHIRHLDLPDEFNYIQALRHYQWNQIRSLRVREDHLDESICSIFPSLAQLDVRMTLSATSSISPCLLSLCTRLTRLRLSFDEAEPPSIDNRIVRSIWHRDSRIQRVSMINGLLIEERFFLEISSSLTRNEHLTHLSIVVADLRSTAPFIALSPALEHLRILLINTAPNWSNCTRHFLKRQQWSSRVKSFYLEAYDTYVNTRCLCQYIRLFSTSLERLTFYAHLIPSYLMRSRRCLEELLLNHLTKLSHLNFCAHSGLGQHEYKNRRLYDSWKHRRHVISIFNSWPGYHTRFTLPFVFDRLDRVTNDFVDFHSNEARPDFVLILPSVTLIDFYAAVPLNLKLMTTIKHACPRLRRVTFRYAFTLSDDLNEDTQLTLPTVKQLQLCDMRTFDNERSFRRLFRLICHLEHLTVDEGILMNILHAMEFQQRKQFDGIRQLTIVERLVDPFVSRELVVEQFPNANVIYRKRSH